MKRRLFYLILAISALVLLSCDKPKVHVLQTISIKEGEHRSTPHHLEWRRLSSRGYRFTFMENCLYDIGDPREQCDWLKLTGSSHHLIDNHRNSHMVAYRQPDVETDSFQLAPYYHEGGEVFHPKARCSVEGHVIVDSIPLVWVTPLQAFETHENISENNDYASFYVENLETGEYLFWENTFPEFERVREIGWWFGGTLPAPHDMDLVRMLIYEE